MMFVRAGLCSLVAFSVLAHGAVESWAFSLLGLGAAALFLLWGVVAWRQPHLEIRCNPLFWPLLVLTGLAWLQWLLGFSVYPYLTKLSALKLTVYLLLFFLSVQVFPTPRRARMLVWFLLVFGFAVAVFGIVQAFAFNGKLYWFRELPLGGTPFGPYVNRNHFAGLMELIIPLGLALLLVRAASRDQLWMVGLFTLGSVGALFLSASRAGIFTFFLQFAFLAVLVWTRSLGRHRMAVAATLLLAGTVFVAWLGVEQALARFGQLSKSVLPIRSRLIMAKDTWRIFLDHPWIGTGWGTFISVYPQYASDYFGGNLVNHAHNDYLEILAETGVVGALTCVALLALLFWLGLARLSSHHEPFALAGRLGALTACFGLLLHGFVDFNFYIPSNALLFLLLAGLATAPHCRPEDGPSQSRTTRREPLLGGRLS